MAYMIDLDTIPNGSHLEGLLQELASEGVEAVKLKYPTLNIESLSQPNNPHTNV